MNERVLDLLSAADPARDTPIAPGDVEALLRRASHDVTSYEPGTPVRRRRVLVAAAAIIAVALVTGTTVAVLRRGAEHPPAAPVVPAPSVAPSCLDGLADGVRPAPYDGVKGRYEYLRNSSVEGTTAELKNGTFAGAQYRVELSTWTAADGSQHRRKVTEQPTYADEASRGYFRAHPGELPKAGTTTEDLPAGELSRTDIPAADPAAMAEALYQPRGNGPSQAITGVADLVRVRVLDAPHRAALLRFLARTDGIACIGEQTDPVGRTGVAVGAAVGAGARPSPGNQGSQSLLVDPGTGEILANGSTDAGGTNWHTLFLERGITDQRG